MFGTLERALSERFFADAFLAEGEVLLVFPRIDAAPRSLRCRHFSTMASAPRLEGVLTRLAKSKGMNLLNGNPGRAARQHNFDKEQVLEKAWLFHNRGTIDTFFPPFFIIRI